MVKLPAWISSRGWVADSPARGTGWLMHSAPWWTSQSHAEETGKTKDSIFRKGEREVVLCTKPTGNHRYRRHRKPPKEREQSNPGRLPEGGGFVTAPEEGGAEIWGREWTGQAPQLSKNKKETSESEMSLEDEA